MAWTVAASQCGHWVEVWLPFFQYYFLVIYLIATVTTNATTSTTTTTTTANTTIIIYTAVTVATTITTTTTTTTVISIIQTTIVTFIIYLSYIFMGTSAKNHIILYSTRIFFVIWVLFEEIFNGVHNSISAFLHEYHNLRAPVTN